MTSTIANLQHATRTLKDGAVVLVLNTGALINPEAEAMLQALHSRSTGGIRAHLEVLIEKGAEHFMGTFYVGYGHKSIGDCGDVTVFVEGVSMLVAKAIQDWRLYAGQESSTRYVDFGAQAFKNPVGTPEGEALQERWRAFYLTGLPVMRDSLTVRYPKAPEEKEGVYQKAIAARAFDTMRAFLPAGATTNLAWHMNLRQFADELTLLRHHPLVEVREVALAVEDALLEAFPSSFTSKRYEATEAYSTSLMRSHYYDDLSAEPFVMTRNDIDRVQLEEYREALISRPPKTELPRHIAECGTMQFRFLLDFGSWRDIQRQRSVVQRMPLLTTRHGFHPWYLGELPEALRTQAEDLITLQETSLTTLATTPEVAQYYLPMGYMTANRLTGDLHALTYIVELRTTRFVHPTLRERAQQMATVLLREFGPSGLTLHLDAEPDRFDVRRGEHDIVRMT
ncbi:MAG: FAD-dependent thymidylate synthase [Candidatus Pacebacteria bacterium]|nr:FAD-dependent thymidylate synthase [Candidatus Paceibacterota bacterium]